MNSYFVPLVDLMVIGILWFSIYTCHKKTMELRGVIRGNEDLLFQIERVTQSYTTVVNQHNDAIHELNRLRSSQLNEIVDMAIVQARQELDRLEEHKVPSEPKPEIVKAAPGNRFTHMKIDD